VRKTVVFVAVLVVVLSACRVDTSVTVKVQPDGSGVVVAAVRLDAAAVKAAEVGGAKLEDAVRLGDLTAAGWKSTGWVRAKNGSAALTLTKGFARAEDAGAVVAELNGADGPLRGVRVTRSTSTFSSDWGFSGVADLKDFKTGITSDQELVGRLAAQRVDVAALDQRLLLESHDALRLHVIADLPHASADAFPVRAGVTTVMHTSSSQTAITRILALVIGLGIGLIAIVLLLAGELRSRRRRV
jgi:hypothetical protein